MLLFLLETMGSLVTNDLQPVAAAFSVSSDAGATVLLCIVIPCHCLQARIWEAIRASPLRAGAYQQHLRRQYDARCPSL